MNRTIFINCLLGVMLAGCSAKYHRNAADRDAARLIAEKTPLVPNMDPQFTIEQDETLSLDGFPVSSAQDDFLGAEAESETGAHILSLEQALNLAVGHSRVYQNQKETVFLQALSLSLARYRFTPIFSAGSSANYQIRAVNVEKEIDRLVGGQIVRETRTVREHEHTIAGKANASGAVLLRTGARLATDFTTDFLRFVSGDRSWATSSRLGATLTQPLLRGAGFLVTMENLTQSERNLLYGLREYTRFRKNFSVQVASEYYRVLQSRDAVRNAYYGLTNAREDAERERAFVDEGRRALVALGQLQQAELSNERSWINALRSYKQNLDQFKITLGISTDSKIVLDEDELKKLTIDHPSIALNNAIETALATRLDLYNERDQFEDSARRIGIAKNSLQADLDLIFRADVATAANRPLDFNFSETRWTAGLDLDLPLDRRAQRNSYRASLIDYERAGRALQLAVDEIKLDIREGWRALDEAKRNFEISELGVDLSLRRVEEQQLLAEFGRGTARDLVDARQDLIDASNRRTSALVQHTIARLQFWRDMGILDITENGQWEEPSHAKND